MPNTIKHISVHDLRKTASGLEVVLGRDGLTINQTTQRVVDGLDELYNKRSSKAHGRFSDDFSNYPTATYFEAYFANNGGNFSEFTGRLMTTLYAKARSVPNAGAGHVFFAHFERNSREFVLITIVNERVGAALTSNFDVLDITHLDLDGFRFAGRVDITSWRAGEDRYIGFLRGRGDVAEYFKEFLACVSSRSDKRSTEELVTALKGYADDQNMQWTARDEFLTHAKTVLDRTARAGDDIVFQALANELVPTKPETLTDYLVHPDRQLGDGFIPNTRILGTLVKFRARTNLWLIEMDRGALRNGEITFDAENNTLTITALPPNLAAALRKEFVEDATDSV